MGTPRKRVTLSKPALFGLVGYQPHPLQLVVHESTARRRVVAAGVRFGKSVIAQHECLAAVLHPCERSRGWVVGPTIDTPDRILQFVRAAIEQHFPHRLRSYDAKTRTLVVTNLGGGRSELRAKSTDSNAGLLGESLDYVVCDEAGSVRQADWEVCVQRLVDRRGWSLAVSVPKGPGWFYEAFRRGQRNRDPECRSWTAPTWANPAIPQDAIDAERSRLSQDAFREQFGGEFIGVLQEGCWTCGGPDPKVKGVILVEGDAPIARCEECSQHVDEDGHTLVGLYSNGQAHLLVIRLYDRQEPASLP